MAVNCKACIYENACDVIEEHECQNIYGYLTGGVFDGCPMFKNKADFVEVVRCKDCLYGEIDNTDFPDQYLCHHSGDCWNNGNHFCSHGVRKVGE